MSNEKQNIKVSLDDFDVDDEIREKSEIEHILDRPGTWIGSVVTELVKYPLYVPSTNKIKELPNVQYNPGLLKLIDEVISNSVDAHRSDRVLFNITKMSVSVNTDGTVCVTDNGGIPVKKLKTGFLVPFSIFGRLRTSTNYNDSHQRIGAGTNGLGVKITNIFSTKFSVNTADGKNSVKIDWKNNMSDVLSQKEIDSRIIQTNEHYTKINFKIDLKRFDLEELSLNMIRIIQKRCIVAAALNPGLEVVFESNVKEGILNSTWKFDSFREYVDLFIETTDKHNLLEFKTVHHHIIIIPDTDFSIGFVNGAVCSEGTHMNKIQSQIVKHLLDYCTSNDMELITEKDIISRFSVFANCTIINPQYTSQAKEKLSSKILQSQLKFDDKFLKSLETSRLVQSLRDYYAIKYLEIKRKETRKLNSQLKNTNTKKLIKPAVHSANSEMWLFEGNSASNGFRKCRDTHQAAYLLRGKILNTFNLDKNQIFENVELREVIAAQKILFDAGIKNVDNLAYNKIIIGTDMDHDGNHICGLLLAFYGKYFPELIKAGKIYRALSPIIIAEKISSSKSPKKYYYTLDEYHADEKSLKGYDITYTKGLGGLSDDDYFQLLRNKKLLQFTIEDVEDIQCLNTWFDKSTKQRQEIIIQE